MTTAGTTAIVDDVGAYTFGELDSAAGAVAAALAASLTAARGAEAETDSETGTGMGGEAGAGDLGGARVAFHVPPGLAWVATLLGTWRAGGVAVPLCLTHPEPELAHVLDDTRAAVVVTGDTAGAGALPARLAAARDAAHVDVDAVLADGAAEKAARGNARSSNCTHVRIEGPASPDAGDHRALILYTSGTTGRPKGVVLSYGNLRANVEAMVEAWGWTADDRIVHVLPLHHTHGIVNALLCALHVGAAVDMLPGFDAARVWDRLADGRSTLFMAVPTIYGRLIRGWEAADGETRRRWSDGARGLRVMVSGSAALPVPVLERWREITGHTLLERYGMTEIGMALSNPLRGERRPGFVGQPLPGVEIRLVDEEGRDVPADAPGEILVRGPAVFREYWERPRETAAAFSDGWFETGDIGILQDGAYRILGRRSVDIIKTGGYKVSALEIENVLGGHPDVRECAVVGVPDIEWGEAVCAALVCARDLDRDEVRDWARDRLAPYKLPQRVLRVPELPKNAMGKVTKPQVRKLFGSVS